MYVLERRQIVPRPLEEAFAFFADPRNLARITPGWLRFRMRDRREREMRRGLELRYRIAPLGLPQPWVSEITVWEPPRCFVDEQRRGPYSRWRHEHAFRQRDGATEIHDRVEYALPFGPLGRLAHFLLVRRQLRAIFDYRERRMRELLG